MMQADFLRMSLNQVDNCVVEARIDAKRRKKYLRTKAKLLQTLEYETGLNLCKTQWQFASECQSIEVKQHEMHDIKKAVGDVEDVSVDLAYDYETTHELSIIVKPIEGLYTMFRFQYRRPHRSTDKCQVETVKTEASSYDRLVCPIK